MHIEKYNFLKTIDDFTYSYEKINLYVKNG